MKKRLALLLALAILNSVLFFGCAKKEKPVEQIKPEETVTDDSASREEEKKEEAKIDFGGKVIRFSAWWNHAPKKTDSLDRIEELQNKYNCKMEFINIPYEQYLEKYITTVMAGDPMAEFVLVDYVWFYPTLSLNGYLTDVTPYAQKGIIDFEKGNFVKTATQICTLNGKIYGFHPGSWQYPSNILYWNKSLFEREGLPNLYELFFSNNWTWDKMLEIAKKATKDTTGDGKINQWGLAGLDLADAIVMSNNARTVSVSDPFNPKFTLNTPEALQALQTWQDWILKEKIIQIPPEGAAWDFAKSSFIEGNVAMANLPLWMIDDIKKNMKDEYGVVLFPKGPNAKDYICRLGSLNVWTIPAATDKKFNLEHLLTFYSEWTQPYPDSHPEDFVENYLESRFKDKESINTFLMVHRKNLNAYDYKNCFKKLVEMSYTYQGEIQSGTKTPQVAISEIAERAQAVIEESIKTKPEELIKK